MVSMRLGSNPGFSALAALSLVLVLAKVTVMVSAQILKSGRSTATLPVKVTVAPSGDRRMASEVMRVGTSARSAAAAAAAHAKNAMQRAVQTAKRRKGCFTCPGLLGQWQSGEAYTAPPARRFPRPRRGSQEKAASPRRCTKAGRRPEPHGPDRGEHGDRPVIDHLVGMDHIVQVQGLDRRPQAGVL